MELTQGKIETAAEGASNDIAQKRYLTVDELAHHLCISRFTIYRMIKRKELTWIPFGRIKRFDREIVEREIKERSIKAKF